MDRCLIIALLLVLGMSLTSQTVTVSLNISDQNYYELGFVKENQTLIFDFAFPNPSNVSTTFTPRIRNSTLGGGQTGPNPSWGSQNVPTSPGTIGPLTWGKVQNDGVYYLHLNSVSNRDSVQVVLITVTRSGQTKPFKAYADFLRDRYSVYMYASKESDLTVTTTASVQRIRLQNMDIDGITQIDTTFGQVTNTDQLTQTIPKGFYRIEYRNNSASLTTTFMTDPYPCPFPPLYYDSRQVFKGCVHSSDPASGNLHAANAILAHQCGSRSYYMNKKCLPVDQSCNTFDYFNGNCRTCKNTNLVADDKGKCVAPSIQCPSGTYEKKGVCVPEGCSGLNVNGGCSGCLSVLDEVSGNSCVRKVCPSGQNLHESGSCIPIVESNQQLLNGVVYTRPEGCAKLVEVKVTGRVSCSDCESGYHFERGVCVLDGGAANLQSEP